MKKLFSITLVVLTLLFLTNCEERTKVTRNEPVEVEFVLNNPGLDNPASIVVTTNSSLKGGTLKAGGDKNIPECVDSVGVSVHLVGVGSEGSFDMILDLIETFDDGKQSILVKMKPGSYTITQFEVLAPGGTIIYASPQEGSYYDNLFDFQNNVEVTFTLIPFNKQKIDIDVLCWQDYKYKEFGYFWLDYHNYAVKTVCFFGDVCTKFFDTWSTLDGSPYANVSINGYDFPALFTVIVANSNDPNHVTTASNFGDAMTTDNVGEPVCVEYLDNLEIEGETYTAQLVLQLPDGSSVILDVVEFTDADFSEVEGESIWGGDDAIWEFAVGDCAMAAHSEDINGVYNIPWIPLPDEITFTLYNNRPESYFALANIIPDVQVGEFVTGDTLAAWCGNEDWNINWNHTYDAHVYPYYDIPTSAPTQYQAITSTQWAKLNWIANKVINANGVSTYAGFDYNSIQNAIWKILGYGGDGNGYQTEIDLIYANAPVTYIPPLGGYIVVLIDPYHDHDAKGDGDDLKCVEQIQLALVRYDP